MARNPAHRQTSTGGQRTRMHTRTRSIIVRVRARARSGLCLYRRRHPVTTRCPPPPPSKPGQPLGAGRARAREGGGCAKKPCQRQLLLGQVRTDFILPKTAIDAPARSGHVHVRRGIMNRDPISRPPPRASHIVDSDTLRCATSRLGISRFTTLAIHNTGTAIARRRVVFWRSRLGLIWVLSPAPAPAPAPQPTPPRDHKHRSQSHTQSRSKQKQNRKLDQTLLRV